jgi:hypothetical protein
MPVAAFNGNGLVSKLEILRGDVVDVLYQATKDQTDYRFDTRITELSQNDDAVEATLVDETKLSVDLVVGADGPHSTVRRLVFGPEDQFVKPLRWVQRMVHRTGHGRARRLVSDVSGAGPQCVDAPVARGDDVQGRVGVSLRTRRLRPPQPRRATGLARTAFRRCRLAMRRVACSGG